MLYNGTENDAYWDAYFSNCLWGIPKGSVSIPGYSRFYNEYFNKYHEDEDIYGMLEEGQLIVDNVVEEMEEKLTEYHKQAMYQYFGIDVDEYAE